MFVFVVPINVIDQFPDALYITYYPFTKALSFSSFVAIRSTVTTSSASVIKMAKSRKKSSFSSHLQEMNKNKTETF